MNSQEKQQDGKNAEKKPYEAPAVEQSAGFETLVCACVVSGRGCPPDDPQSGP